MNNIKNQRFGRLLVLERNGITKSGNIIWKCKCDCGNVVSVAGGDLLSSSTKSCSCLRTERNFKHGLCKHPLYQTLNSMKKRCFNKRNKDYKDYGGRDIKICERWMTFKNFYNDMIDTWKPGLEIDRIDNDGNYELGNCRWTTKSVQASNKRGFGTSKYRGVCKDKPSKKWKVQIMINGKRKYLGLFKTEKEAYEAILKARNE